MDLSPGLRTDLALHKSLGEVRPVGEYIIVNTPTRRDYYYGNCLVFAKPPTLSDVARWQGLFQKTFGTVGEISHVLFQWMGEDNPDDDVVSAFAAEGFEYDPHVALSASRLIGPTEVPAGITVRPITTAREWAAVTELQVQTGEANGNGPTFRPFKAWWMEQMRRLVETDNGLWFGAFSDERLVAGLGIFAVGGALAVQAVETAPDFRRMGIASALLSFSGRDMQRRYPNSPLEIVADHGSDAERLYRKLGFTGAAREDAMLKRPLARRPLVDEVDAERQIKS